MSKRKEIVLNENFKEFIELLNSKKVKYLLIGGYAVGLYGYPRYTGDLDVWIKPDLNNSAKILGVLNIFGFASLNLDAKDFCKTDFVHQFGYPPLRIDVLTGVSGLKFDECYKRKKKMMLDGVSVNVLEYNDLKKNKLSSGRPEDLFDIKKLEQTELNAQKTSKHKKI